MKKSQRAKFVSSASDSLLHSTLLRQPQGIEIIFDRTRQISGNEIEIYSSDADYFMAYVSLQTAIKQQEDARVIVHSNSLKTWLVNGLSKYKHAKISQKELTYRDLLAAKWKISSFDMPLSDVQIQRQKLLDLPIEGTQVQPLSSFICQAFLSPYLDGSQCNTSNFDELLNDLLDSYAKKDRLPGIVTTVYKDRLTRWMSSRPECAELMQGLMDNFWSVYENCSLYKLTANYPESVRIKCLGEPTIRTIHQAGLHLDDLDTSAFQKESPLYGTVLTQELTLFFHAFETAHPTLAASHIEELLGYCSRELTQEIDYILNLLNTNVYLLTHALITRIKTAFKALLTPYNEKIEELRAYVPPAKPPPFPKDADRQTVIDWAVREYLPYKFWQETTRQQDQAILAHGKEFAEYIFEHYIDLSYHYEKVLYRFVFNYKELIAETSFPILLILDNFNYKFFPALRASLARYSIVPKEQIEPYLCLLPSETACSKKGIISGKRNQEDTVQYSYHKNLIDQWQEFFPNHRLTYLSKVGELDEYAVTGHEFLVINYLEIDAELHKSFQKTAIEHRKTVEFHLNQLTTFLARFIQRNHLEENARIFLVSDHGSTLIPDVIPNEIETESFKGQAVENKHRFLTVNDEQFEVMRQNVNIADSLFFLGKDMSGDRKNYVIARGYNRFKEIREDFYVHGGALPEELILPVGCFEWRTQEVKKLILQLKKTEYRLLTKETIILRLANPNALPIQHLSIKVFSQGMPLAVFELDELGSHDDRELSQDIRIKHKEMAVFQCEIYYEAAGKSFQENTEFPITIKTITQVKFDFDEL